MARKILLADDSVTAQNMGRKILADAGYEVTTVNNGSAALKKIGEQRPDLIVLDVYMPGYSGLEVCQRLKDVPDTSRIPVLLTVGKLEPFKPEEARRVRADGFIVKPFEASELLSALSKLEDKVVPRPESSKPGRFARASAAIEEGRFDRSMAADEDSGWKNRIVFPPKKKQEKIPEPEVDDPAIYNPVNRDLRTVMEPRQAQHPPVSQSQAEEERVNLSALAPEGLPKDVTPEEIAALAAAAAQVKETIAQASSSESAAQPKSVDPTFEVKSDTVGTFSNEYSKDEQKPFELDAPAILAGSGNGASHPAFHAADEPVTMAVAAGMGASSARWTAVAVALAPEETAVSLEQEMLQLQSSFAVIEAVPVVSATPTPEPEPAAMAMAHPEVQAEVIAPEPLPQENSASAIETSQPAPEPVSIATGSSESDTKVIAGTEHSSLADSYAAEPQSAAAQIGAEKPADAPVPPVSEAPEVVAEKPEELASQAATAEMASSEIQTAQPEVIPTPAEERTPEQSNNEASIVEAPFVTPESEATKEEASEIKFSSDTAETVVSIPTGGPDEMAKKETEVAANTAAAWASWRKIRETGQPAVAPAESAGKAIEETDSEASGASDAAMAVAAGAEHSPEDANVSSESEDIASIVDSVLADLRPKIVEEISRKLGKKK